MDGRLDRGIGLHPVFLHRIRHYNITTHITVLYEVRCREDRETSHISLLRVGNQIKELQISHVYM